MDLVATAEGIICHLAIPMASSQTVLNVNRAHLMPMPDPRDAKALVWDIEGEFLAISEDQRDNAIPTPKDLQTCLGSPLNSICATGSATYLTKTFCLAALYFGSTEATMSVCSVRTIDLPTVENATNVGIGRWLITAANENFTFRESKYFKRGYHLVNKTRGCRVCLIVLVCDSRIQTDNSILRPNLDTCSSMEHGKHTTHLADPLHHLLNMPSDINQLPNFQTRFFLKEVRIELSRSRTQIKWNKRN